MYKVLIVDDEEFIIKSLIKGTNWSSYDFEVVSSAKDGVEAFEKICEIKPHVVFTDIRMPGMSGLELIKNVQAIHKDILFVVISGYAEFAYAQKALDYGAIGYCLKPFDDEEINTILKKARNILGTADNGDKCDIISLFAEDSESRQRLDAFFKTKGIMQGDRIYIIASIGGKPLRLKNNLDYINFKTGSHKEIYILSSDRLGTDQIIQDTLPEGIKGIGIFEAAYTSSNMRKYIDSAYTLAYQYFTTGTRNVYIKINTGNIDIENLIEKYENLFSKMDIRELVQLLDTFYNNAVSGVFSIKHAMNIYNTYVKYSIKVLGEDAFEEYIYSFDDLCYLFKDLYTMIEYIKDKITCCLGFKTNKLTDDVRNEYFKKIIHYINQNFYKEITIRNLSQDFTINPNYLSQLFRKEVGMTFTDYITKLRMNYAKELLLKTEYSQGDVATKCGYIDYFYFIRVFKKSTGVTPGQYRHKDE